MLPQTIVWDSARKALNLLDQRLLPHKVEIITCRTYEDVALAIENMTVRGAPAIGVAAAYGVLLAALESADKINGAIERLAATRPTAVNLIWALERMKKTPGMRGESNNILSILENEAKKIHEEDIAANVAIGDFGQSLLSEKATVITHCNAGALATAGFGTALGVFRAAAEQGKELKIYACETRPRLQGAKLTAVELFAENFDVTVITDSMAAFLMSREKIDAVVTGADRIALNGDTANKIGTYSLAVAAQRHGVPFYIAAPLSTFDIECESGADIPIEIRSGDEIRFIDGTRLFADEIKVWNPAFDVTPSELISAIITETGIIYKPFKENFLKIFE